MSTVPAEFLSPSGKYAPGHDAKHVSALVAEAKAGGFKVTVVRTLSKQLPTPALVAKFEKAIIRAQAPKPGAKSPEEKAAAAAARAEAKAAKDAEKVAAANAPKLKDLEVLDPAAIIRSEERPDLKIGRNFYPARISHTEDGGAITEVNTAKDGSGQWVIAPEQVEAPAAE